MIQSNNIKDDEVHPLMAAQKLSQSTLDTTVREFEPHFTSSHTTTKKKKKKKKKRNIKTTTLHHHEQCLGLDTVENQN